MREKAYRVYMTDCLRLVCKVSGSYPSKRFAEILDPPAEDLRSGDDVAKDIIQRAGIKIKESGQERTETG